MKTKLKIPKNQDIIFDGKWLYCKDWAINAVNALDYLALPEPIKSFHLWNYENYCVRNGKEKEVGYLPEVLFFTEESRRAWFLHLGYNCLPLVASGLTIKAFDREYLKMADSVRGASLWLDDNGLYVINGVHELCMWVKAEDISMPEIKEAIDGASAILDQIERNTGK